MGEISTPVNHRANIFKSFGVLVSGIVIVFLQSGSFKALGVLFEDIVRQYKISNLFGGWALTFQPAATFVIAGISGGVLRRSSNRFIGTLGGFLFGIGFVLQGLFGQTLLHLFIFTGVTAVGAGWLLFSSYLSFMEHFGESFPLAYSIRELFTYLGVTFMPPMMEFFRGQYGLHGSFLITGAVIWNAIVSGVLMKSVDSQKYAATDKRTVVPKETESALSRGENEKQSTHLELLSFLSISPAVEHPVFALFMIIHSLFSYIFVAWALFLVPFATSIGFPPEIAVFLSTAGGVGGFIGKIAVVVIFYVKRMNILVSSLVPAVMYSLAILGYVFSQQYTVLLGASVVSGFSIAFADAALNGSLPRYLPERHLKQGAVLSYIFSGVFMQLSGIISGAILDATSSFSLLYGVMLILNVLSMILAVVIHGIVTKAK